ncbi:MAG TPA: RraA family protein, partial [Xanthobacteraceae bacterium]|nr:RraA family protein [Xanthobacteraceae bacterium]
MWWMRWADWAASIAGSSRWSSPARSWSERRSLATPAPPTASRFSARCIAARQGDIVVAATDAFTHTAIAGDLLLGMARNRGVAGFVTDGSVRDLAGVLAVGLPVYCAGLTANSAARNGPGTVGLPIVVGGVAVESGDILVGDRDGVVVVPLKQAQAVLAKLADVRAAEVSLEAKVKAGL